MTPEATHQGSVAMQARPEPDVAALERALRDRVRGEVRFDAGSRTLYATDASNYWQVPIGVVVPRDERDVIATVEVCRAHHVPVLTRGGGTSLAGQTCNVAVVLDFSKHMNQILDLNAEARTALVQPGVVLDDLRDAAAAHGLTFGPDPSTHNRCTLGGMIGNDSCGVHSLTAGRTAENVVELDVLLYDGTRFTARRCGEDEVRRARGVGDRYGELLGALWDLQEGHADQIRARYPRIPRRVSGYNLDALLPENGFDLARALVGSEGTCVIVLRAVVRLVPAPRRRTLVVAGYVDIFAAADDVPRVLESHPIGLEAIDGRIVREMREKGLHADYLGELPDGDGWLMAEFGGDTEAEAQEAAGRLVADLRRRDRPWSEIGNPEEQEHLWQVRESGLPADARGPGRPDTWEGWEDSAVAPERLGDYLRDLRTLWDAYGYEGSMYGHFGDGCVHTRISFDLSSHEGIERFDRFLGDAARLVVSYGGSLSGEHGDGQSRADLLPVMFGDRLVAAFEAFKRIFDPECGLNPGKLVRAYAPTENLRFAPGSEPVPVETRFQYPNDDHDFHRAVTRCVGVGVCRRSSGGIMCPSYMVTREERHSTRGRARMLEGMLRGEVIQDLWRSEEAKEALDLCLSCKGCKVDCPMGVDMATYKAEFLSHYYEGRARPRSAYTMGRIREWSRLARMAPRLANLGTQTPVLRRAAVRLTGVHPKRRLPAFAAHTFRAGFERRRAAPGAPRAVLFPDTFNDHFHPEVLHASVALLRDAGYAVSIPRRAVCCGRPLYDHGWVDTARRRLARAANVLARDVQEGAVVVGAEPSCMAVFRDELQELLPDHPLADAPDAWALTLEEALERTDYVPPRREGPVLVQGHCHQRSVMDMAPQVRLLEATGADVRLLDTTCCGMAGSFGFERDKYDVSVAVAEHGLLPALRAAPTDATVITTGFSCRTQVEHLSERRPLHMAEFLRRDEGGLR